jgi:hypothetical protein
MSEAECGLNIEKSTWRVTADVSATRRDARHAAVRSLFGRHEKDLAAFRNRASAGDGSWNI